MKRINICIAPPHFVSSLRDEFLTVCFLLGAKNQLFGWALCTSCILKFVAVFLRPAIFLFFSHLPNSD